MFKLCKYFRGKYSTFKLHTHFTPIHSIPLLKIIDMFLNLVKLIVLNNWRCQDLEELLYLSIMISVSLLLFDVVGARMPGEAKGTAQNQNLTPIRPVLRYTAQQPRPFLL